MNKTVLGGEMNKTILETRIREIAEERFNKLYNETRDMYLKNDILKDLKLDLVGKFKKSYLFKDYSSDNITLTLNGECLGTNFTELKEEIIRKYEKEEIDKIIFSSESIQKLLQQNNC